MQQQKNAVTHYSHRMGESRFGDVDFLFRFGIIFLTGDALYAILNLLPMTTMNDKSLTKAADPSFVVIGSTLLTSQGSVAFAGLRNGGAVVAVQDGSVGKIYPISSEIQPIAEAQDGTPVASGMDWFEVAGLTLVAEGRISETRFRRAMDAVRKGVDRE